MTQPTIVEVMKMADEIKELRHEVKWRDGFIAWLKEGSDKNYADMRMFQAKFIEADQRINELEFDLNSMCPCINNPQDENYLLVDEMCPIHGHPLHELSRREKEIKRYKTVSDDYLKQVSYLEHEVKWRDELIARMKEAGDNLIQLANFKNKKAIEYIDAWSDLTKTKEKIFCPNCEKDTECTHEAELYVCNECGEDFAKYIVQRKPPYSDVSVTRGVLTDVKNTRSIENNSPDRDNPDYKKELE